MDRNMELEAQDLIHTYQQEPVKFFQRLRWLYYKVMKHAHHYHNEIQLDLLEHFPKLLPNPIHVDDEGNRYMLLPDEHHWYANQNHTQSQHDIQKRALPLSAIFGGINLI